MQVCAVTGVLRATLTGEKLTTVYSLTFYTLGATYVLAFCYVYGSSVFPVFLVGQSYPD